MFRLIKMIFGKKRGGHMAKSKPKQQQWNEYLKNMTQEEKEFM